MFCFVLFIYLFIFVFLFFFKYHKEDPYISLLRRKDDFSICNIAL